MESENKSSEKLNNILKLYINQGYFSLYGIDILISIIIILIIGYTSIYFFIISFRPYISKNWPLNRCNPLYMPFAGILNKDNNKSFFRAAEENFNFCIGNILHAISEKQFSPLYYANKIINDLLSIISKAINSVREMINKIRVFFANIASNISNRTLNIMMPIVSQNLKIFDVFNRVHGLLMASVYQVFGLFTTSYSLFGFFRDGIIGLLIILSATIFAMWGLAASQIAFPPTIAAGVALGITAGLQVLGYIAILIPFLIVIIIMSEVYNARGGKKPPKVPSQ